MNKDIRYNGITENTSDYNAKDGDLTTAINLIADTDGLKPFIAPTKMFSLPYGSLRYIHNTAQYKHYIAETVSGNIHTICHYIPDTQTFTLVKTFDAGVAIHDVSGMGNTLVILASDGIHYILWRQEGASYIYLGQKPPELDMRFSMSYNLPAPYDMSPFANPGSNTSRWDPINPHEKTYGYACRMSPHDGSTIVSPSGKFFENVRTDLNNTIWALVNSANAVISSLGHFYAPFFVRYCYRLYDGTQFMHSVPIFMPLSGPFQYFVICNSRSISSVDGSMRDVLQDPYGDGHLKLYIWYWDEDGSDPTGNGSNVRRFDTDHNTLFSYFPINEALQYSLGHLSTTVADTLRDWADIITSVDIFVSPPFIREKVDEPIEGLTHRPLQTAMRDQFEIVTHWYHQHGNIDEPYADVDFPLEDIESYCTRLSEVNTFYKVKSIPINTIIEAVGQTGFRDVDIPSNVLPILATQEAMTDDYKSHNRLLPFSSSSSDCITSLFAYNAKLNIAAPVERFHGFPFYALTRSNDEFEGHPLSATNISHPDLQMDIEWVIVSEVYVTLRTSEGLKYVKANSPYGNIANGQAYISTTFYSIFCSPIFYPDSRAISLTLKLSYKVTNNSTPFERFYTAKMTPSPFLNASCTQPLALISHHVLTSSTPISTEINNQVNIHSVLTTTPPTFIADQDTVAYPNKLYTSETNNPFVFPPTSINTVGSGVIIGLSAAAKALSQGQFGQFPLYAFTDEGIWSLAVSSTGGYNSVQPLSRDVCINKKSITQLDSAVLFCSQRGLMLVSGSDVSCISEAIQNIRHFNPVTELPLSAHLAILSGLPTSSSIYPDIPFREYLSKADIFYIYTRQLIIVYRSDKNYSYAYSLSGKQWTTIVEDEPITNHLNSYPDAIALRNVPYRTVYGTIAYTQDVYNYSREDYNTDPAEGPVFFSRSLLLSRAINLDYPNSLKTITSLIQRGDFERGHVRTILYGSRDLRHWIYVASSRDHFVRGFSGTPYKYFRIALLINLYADETIYGASCQFNVRESNKPR
ncbi:MAG: hypothetical protein IJR13_07855 [Bacteroidales bacterium]|nr:hypothetical protein [Bacteroidales bacterium]